MTTKTTKAVLAQPCTTLHNKHLVFHPKDEKVKRLRTARLRGTDSWFKKLRENHQEILDRKVNDSLAVYHELARTVNFSTLSIGVGEGEDGESGELTLTAVGPARTIEVPDDDNTLLFATRPKAIRPVGFHNDIHSANNFVTYAATYTELLPPSELGEMAKVEGGLQIWKCMLHYYPHDKSARVVDPKWADERFKGQSWAKIKLPNRFKNARASCRKTWNNEVSLRTRARGYWIVQR